jgi:hypothetical protein
MPNTFLAQGSSVQWREVSWLESSQLVRGLVQFSRCELLLLDTGSWGMGIVREPSVRGKSAVETTTKNDWWKHRDWEDLVRAAVNSRVCELTKALQ